MFKHYAIEVNLLFIYISFNVHSYISDIFIRPEFYKLLNIAIFVHNDANMLYTTGGWHQGVSDVNHVNTFSLAITLFMFYNRALLLVLHGILLLLIICSILVKHWSILPPCIELFPPV